VVDTICHRSHSDLLWYHVVERTSGRTMNKYLDWAAVAAVGVVILFAVVAQLFGK
jgi:hypothetical protein